MAGQAEQEFLKEAEELVATFGRDLLRYEEAVLAGVKINPDTLKQAFNAVHSLKGLAGMFGRLKMCALALAMENLLKKMRLKKVPCDSQVLDVLFEALGRLDAMLSSGKEENINIDQIKTKLEQASEAKLTRTGKSGKPSKSLKGIPEEVRDVLTEFEEFRLAENIRLSVHIVKVSVSFDLTNFDTGLSEFMNWLKEHCEVITTLPGDNVSDNSKIYFDFLVGTEESPDEFTKFLQERGATLEVIKQAGGGKKANPNIGKKSKAKKRR